ncbi:MAG: beta-ketoacyl synthase chain length factor [Sedimenticola sp.]
MAPGLTTRDAWISWLQQPQAVSESLGKIPLKQIPPLLRRRFNTLGRCAVGAALPLLSEGECISSIFASRHGDTGLTLSLLEGMGRSEPMSPTGFSLAVHNAVSGLFSIARKDTSAVVSIAAMEGLVLQALLEAGGQLQGVERVLCVIYDVPLPPLYQPYSESDPFPYAIAMILGRTEGNRFTIDLQGKQSAGRTPASGDLDTEPMRLLHLLAGRTDHLDLQANGACWRMSKVAD